MLKGSWFKSVASFIPLIKGFFHDCGEALQFGKLAHAQTKYQEHRETITQEPVCSLSRRGTRELCHFDAPRDFAPKVAYTPYSKMAANKLFFCLHVN